MNAARNDQQFVELVTSQLTEATGGFVDHPSDPSPRELDAAAENDRKRLTAWKASGLSAFTHSSGRK